MGTGLTAGDLIDGSWRVDALLGGGGMGNVYACSHVRNGLRVAIKMLHRHHALDASVRARFVHEGRALNKISHPGVVRALGDGVHDGAPYLVMDLVEGRSLKGIAVELGRPMTPEELAPILTGLLDVLAAVHDAGVVHRDIKPDNVLLSNDNHVILVDFGIARLEDGVVAGATQTGSFVGTPAYMAPEQILGRRGVVDGRTDLFCAGGIAWTMLSGRRLRDDCVGAELLVAIATRPIPSLLQAAPGVRPAIARVIDRALAYDKDARFSSAREMKAAWLEALTHPALTADVTTPFVRTPSFDTVPGATTPLVRPSSSPMQTASAAPPPTLRMPSASGRWRVALALGVTVALLFAAAGGAAIYAVALGPPARDKAPSTREEDESDEVEEERTSRARPSSTPVSDPSPAPAIPGGPRLCELDWAAAWDAVERDVPETQAYVNIHLTAYTAVYGLPSRGKGRTFVSCRAPFLDACEESPWGYDPPIALPTFRTTGIEPDGFAALCRDAEARFAREHGPGAAYSLEISPRRVADGGPREPVLKFEVNRGVRSVGVCYDRAGRNIRCLD